VRLSLHDLVSCQQFFVVGGALDNTSVCHYDVALKHFLLNFMVTPCISNIQHFNIQLMHTTLKKRRVIKTF